MSNVLRNIVLLLNLFVAQAVSASDNLFETAQWDLGIGAGGFKFPLYPGSRAENKLLLPVPYFTFKSPLLEIDRGIKGFLYSSDAIVMDISADFALPVDSSDSLVRRGMPDLDAVLQLGPSIEFLFGERSDRVDTRLEIPMRLAFATNIKDTENLGWLLEPRMSFEVSRQARYGLSYKFTTGVLYASEDYHAYYYTVPTAFAGAQRSAYTAAGGYGGAFISLRSTYRYDDWVAWTYLRLTSLQGSVIEDSPLVETSRHYFLGVGLAWVFASN